MDILGLIPARGGSKEIPNKNIKILNGKPLIAYTIHQALQSKLLTNLIVSTDSRQIAEIAKYYNADVPFLRPERFSTNTSASIEYVKHAISFLKTKGKFFDAICILQPTSPYRPVGIIDKAIRLFIKSKADSLISMRKVPPHYNPHWTFFKNQDNILTLSTGENKIISRRQDLPDAYIRDGAIYIIKINLILNNSKLLGGKIIGFNIESPELINIDTLNDWEIAEKYIKC